MLRKNKKKLKRKKLGENEEKISKKRRPKKEKESKRLKKNISSDKNMKIFQSCVHVLGLKSLPCLRGPGVRKKRIKLKRSPNHTG